MEFNVVLKELFIYKKLYSANPSKNLIVTSKSLKPPVNKQPSAAKKEDYYEYGSVGRHASAEEPRKR